MSDGHSRRSSNLLVHLVVLWTLFHVDAVVAWGERGHDIVARLAARHLVEQGDEKLFVPFQQREFMLGHLANVPDIVWKSDSVDEKIRSSNRPTHYINLDLVNVNPVSIDDIPLDYAALLKVANIQPVTNIAQLGSAPWRIQQLHQLMTQAFARARESKDRTDLVKHVNSALLYGGLMAHFVGDLGNPHHTTSDFDGQATGNGGLHAYFETRVVNELGLQLPDRVFQTMQKDDLIEQRLMQWVNADRAGLKRDPLRLSLALTLDSYNHLPKLLALDDQFSLIKRSDKSNTYARRRHPRKVKKQYESFIVSRLALSSYVLADLWKSAWQQGGSPDLSGFFSFYYPTAPGYIYPDYQ